MTLFSLTSLVSVASFSVVFSVASTNSSLVSIATLVSVHLDAPYLSDNSYKEDLRQKGSKTFFLRKVVLISFL